MGSSAQGHDRGHLSVLQTAKSALASGQAFPVGPSVDDDLFTSAKPSPKSLVELPQGGVSKQLNSSSWLIPTIITSYLSSFHRFTLNNALRFD